MEFVEVDFADAPRRFAAELDDDRHDQPDVFENFRLGQAEPGLHGRQRNALERAARVIRMQRRQRTGMAGVDGLKEGIGFGAADFAQEQSVRPQPESRLEQALDRNPRLPLSPLDATSAR